MPQINVIKLAGDFVVFGALVIPVLMYKSYSEPPHLGFFCNDESIRYPLLRSTVSTTLLFILSFILPLLSIAAVEASEVYLWEKKSVFETNYFLNNFFVHRYFIRLYIFIGYYVLGILFTMLMADTAKLTAGSLRPNFMATCRPDRGWLNCTEPNEYISDYRCTNSNFDEVTDARRSFYSGHAASIFYAAVYMILYAQARFSRAVYARLVLPLVQFVLLVMAIYVACTRLSDYKHRLSDVLVGTFMGSLAAFCTATRVCKIFERSAAMYSEAKKTERKRQLSSVTVDGKKDDGRVRANSLPLPPRGFKLEFARSEPSSPIHNGPHQNTLVY